MQFNNKFPEDKYMVVNKNLLPLYFLNGTDLTDKIRDFCGTYPVMKVAEFNAQSEMEDAVLTTMKGNLFQIIFFFNMYPSKVSIKLKLWKCSRKENNIKNFK